MGHFILCRNSRIIENELKSESIDRFIFLIINWFHLQKYRDPADNGDWSTLYQPPYYSEDSKYYLLVTPQEDRDHGKYLHITKVDLSQPNTSNLEHSITLGPFEVQKILAWDEKQKQM